MTRRPHHKPPTRIKVKVTIAPLKNKQPLPELAQRFDAHPIQITQWKAQLLEHSADTFGDKKPKEAPVDLKTLHAKIGQLTLEDDFLEDVLTRRDWRDNVFMERLWRSEI